MALFRLTSEEMQEFIKDKRSVTEFFIELSTKYGAYKFDPTTVRNFNGEYFHADLIQSRKTDY
jgi:hypothetical protein